MFKKWENYAVLHTSGLQSVAKMTLRFPVYNIDAHILYPYLTLPFSDLLSHFWCKNCLYAVGHPCYGYKWQEVPLSVTAHDVISPEVAMRSGFCGSALTRQLHVARSASLPLM